MSSINPRPYSTRANNNIYVLIRRHQRNINRQRRIRLQIQMMQSLQDIETNRYIDQLFGGGSFNPF
uniref:Uncharacterized protein n=1 Tax=Rhizophagus irregularis (strain DAOM 181602 / DAOM 197198 / MUCL 43194) TaxID=747089 RepID=U9TEI9_RHIID